MNKVYLIVDCCSGAFSMDAPNIKHDYHMIGHRVEWQCENMVMVHKSDTTVVKDNRGEINLNPLTYHCVSIW